jgi:hypothetical protein
MPQVAWLGWIALTVALTAGPYLWHLRYFSSPGPQFLPVYLGALAVLGAATFLYLRRRRPRWELRGFVLFFLAFCLFYQPVATLYALWIWFVCFGLGRLLLGSLAETALEQVVLFTAAGLGMLSAVMFLLGLAGLYHRALLLALLGLAALAFWRNLSRLLTLFSRLEQAYLRAGDGPLWGLCLVFLFVFSVSSVMVALSPEIAFDPVSFHFVFAREYALRHTLEAIPRLPYSYFPQNVEILYTLGFLLHGQALAKLVTYLYYPLAALTLVLLGVRWFSAQAGLIGAALFCTTPFIAWTGSVAKNDLALALYLLLALYGVLRWVESKRFAWVAAGTFFLGLSFGVKHVAVLGALPLAAVMAWGWLRVRMRMREAALLAVIFAASGLYWHARTYALAGHPLYPEFGGSAMASKTAAGHPELSRLDRLRLYLLTPWTVHFSGLHAFESPSENPLGFTLLAFLPLLFLRGGLRSTPARLALLFAIAYFLYWAAILIKVRYAIAAFGVLFVYLADRLAAFYKHHRATVLGVSAYCLVFALSLALILEMNVPRLKLFARRIGEQQFLRESLVTYRAIEAMNRVARPGDLAYSVGNCSTFYSNIEFHCYYDAWNNYSLEQIEHDLRVTSYEYLIVPAGWAEPGHLKVVEAVYRPSPLYADPHFRVYRLGAH